MVLIIKVRRDSREDPAFQKRDLAFVKRHIAEGWADTLVVQEANEGEIIADLVKGKTSLDVLAGLLE